MSRTQFPLEYLSFELFFDPFSFGGPLFFEREALNHLLNLA
jgi:hypothetical protein